MYRLKVIYVCVLADELQGPKKKPRILPGEEIDLDSKKVRLFFLQHSSLNIKLSFDYLSRSKDRFGLQFRRKLKTVAVDGLDILTAARDACQKSLKRMEAKDAAAKEKAKREEERVAELKRIRGERWLPSIAKEMKVKYQD